MAEHTSELKVEDVSALKVADLKNELQQRGLSTKGLKQELANRLTEVSSPALAERDG